MVLQVNAAPTSVIQAFRRPIVMNMEPGRRRMPGSWRPDISTTTTRCRDIDPAATSTPRRHRPRGDIGLAATSAPRRHRPAATSARTRYPGRRPWGCARSDRRHRRRRGPRAAPLRPRRPGRSSAPVARCSFPTAGHVNRARQSIPGHPETPPSGSRHMTAVRARGLEPPPPLGDRDLNPARLPIPPRPQRPRRAGEQGVYGDVPTDAPSAH